MSPKATRVEAWLKDPGTKHIIGIGTPIEATPALFHISHSSFLGSLASNSTIGWSRIGLVSSRPIWTFVTHASAFRWSERFLKGEGVWCCVCSLQNESGRNITRPRSFASEHTLVFRCCDLYDSVVATHTMKLSNLKIVLLLNAAMFVLTVYTLVTMNEGALLSLSAMDGEFCWCVLCYRRRRAAYSPHTLSRHSFISVLRYFYIILFSLLQLHQFPRLPRTHRHERILSNEQPRMSPRL